MSSMEAKYIAAAEAAIKAIWIRAITIADEPSVQRDNNLADPFTKPMPCTKHVERARSIRFRPAGSFM
ncbi:hypothetical protein Tco_0179180 [Tanacetum coccineum]